MEIKCEMISCSNKESIGYQYLWKVDVLIIEKVFYFDNIKSSKIKNINFENDCITIETKNTTYIFKEVN